MSKQISKTSHDQLIDILEEYKAAGNEWPAEKRDIAAWAVENGLWEPQPSQTIKLCAAALGEAFRKEEHTDRQGNRVRSMYVARVTTFGPKGEKVQRHLWGDIRSGSRDHLLTSFTQQRRQAVDDLRSLKRQVDSANANNPNLKGHPIQLDFDLTDDVEKEEETEPANEQ